MNEPKVPHIVIVGGGFGGINAAKKLGGDPRCRVTLVDRRNHHLFQPLLYQVAMAGLDPSDIASPIRSLLSRYANVSTLLAEVQSIDLAQQRLQLATGELTFDHLILACGASVTYFGNDRWQPFAPGLKSIPQATEVRRRVLAAFEAAEQAVEAEEQDRQLTFAIIGGGPTGVELAGAIAEMAKKTLRRDFKAIDPASARILLIEGGNRVLSSFSEQLSEYAKHALEDLGVEVHLGKTASKISAEGIEIDGRAIPAATVIWAAGVRPNPLAQTEGFQTNRAGRVQVDECLAVPGHPNVFVIGDMAAANDQEGNPLPGIAPVAIQQGKYVGKLLRRELKTAQPPKRKPFKYFDKGQMATIGRHRAVLQSGKIQLTGTIAWLGWLFVHILFLNGMRNRVFVFLSWVWSYTLYARGARLIVDRDWQRDA